jgi:hypothetical protein
VSVLLCSFQLMCLSYLLFLAEVSVLFCYF